MTHFRLFLSSVSLSLSLSLLKLQSEVILYILFPYY